MSALLAAFVEFDYVNAKTYLPNWCYHLCASNPVDMYWLVNEL